jgi:CO dehydrogenase maturation factor
MESEFMGKKMSVCGKGGCGKSVITSLITKVLAEEGYNVLTIDSDESNPGLYRLLGFEQSPTPLVEEFRGGARIMPEFELEKLSVGDIPGEYLAQKNNVKLMVAGKIDFAFQGCACTLGSIIKHFLEKLSLGEKEVVLLDTEAGVEHFGRGLEKHVDIVIAVVEPSFESLAVAEKINSLAAQIGTCKVTAIINKVSTEKEELTIKEKLNNRGIPIAGTIHYDGQIAEDSLYGRPLGETPAKVEVKSIIRSLLGGENAQN